MPRVVSYRKSVFRVCISETLDVIEDEPGNRNHHKNDKRDSNEENRRSVHATQIVWLHSTEGNVHQDSRSVVYHCGQSFTILSVDENGNNIWYYKTQTNKHKAIGDSPQLISKTVKLRLLNATVSSHAASVNIIFWQKIFCHGAVEMNNLWQLSLKLQIINDYKIRDLRKVSAVGHKWIVIYIFLVSCFWNNACITLQYQVARSKSQNLRNLIGNPICIQWLTKYQVHTFNNILLYYLIMHISSCYDKL